MSLAQLENLQTFSEQEGGMRADVRLYGFVRDIANGGNFAVELSSGSTLRDLLNELVKLAGERLRSRLFTETGGLEANVQVFVGNDQAASLDQLVAEDGQQSAVRIFVLSATAGG